MSKTCDESCVYNLLTKGAFDTRWVRVSRSFWGGGAERKGCEGICCQVCGRPKSSERIPLLNSSQYASVVSSVANEAEKSRPTSSCNAV